MRSSLEVARYIEYLLSKKKMKPIELAKKVGVDRSTISRYLNGTRKISMDDLPKLAEGLGVTPTELLLREEDLSKVTNLYPIPSHTTEIPLIGEIACGEPILAKENIAEYIVESSELLPAGNLFYLKANGDSMHPTISDGSLVLIREQATVENKEIAAVLMNGNTEATLKRVKRQGYQLMLISDNPEFMPIIIDENNPAKIIGKAISVRKNL